MNLEELVAAAVKATGMSESMVKRSAAARAKAQGSTIEAVLAEWAGVPASAAAGGAEPAAAAEAPPAATAEAAPQAEEPAAGQDQAPVAAETASAAAESAVPAEEAGSEAPAGLEVEESGEETPPAPRHVSEPVVVREVVPAGAIPRWLAALFVAVPLFALAYIGFLPNGPGCGDAGRLAIDPVSGEMINCDGSAIGAEGEIDYFALGQETYESIGCSACHGPGGEGRGSFPAFTGGALLTTFPEGQCSTHVDWVRLGTTQWPDPTYGANGKPVGGSGAVMPSFGGQLSDDELKAVALYERVAFGGQELGAAQLDCVGPPTAEPPAEG